MYKLNCTNNNLSIIIQDTEDNTFNEYTFNEGVELIANRNYNIYIHNNGMSYSDAFSIVFPDINSFFELSYTISSNDTMYLKVQSSSPNITTLKSNNGNIKLEFLNVFFQSISNFSDNITIRYDSNIKYYLKIVNTSSSNQVFNLTQESFDIITYDESFSTSINKYYSYYKFVSPTTATYIFDLIPTTTSNFFPNVEMYSSSFNLLSNLDVVNVKNKELYSVSLTKWQVIYLAIKNEIDYNKNITILAETSNYYWMVDGVISNDRIVNMNRSGNDSIRVAYYCNGYQLKGAIKFLNASSQYFINTPYISGYEYDITLKSNAELNLNCTTYLSLLFEAYEGETAFTTQEFYVFVDPYININLNDTTDIYDYSVIIDTDELIIHSNESISITLLMKNKNNSTTTKTFNSNQFDCAEFPPISNYYKVGDLEISIFSVTFTVNSNSKTYYVSSSSNLFNDDLSSVIKKGYIQNGDGTESSPYLITSYRELNNIREISQFDFYYESYYINGYFKLMNNITCSGTWQPIETYFKGTFDGNNKTISNLTMIINSSNNFYGLFRSTTNATFNNLTISNVNLTSGTNTSSISIGGICGNAIYTDFNGCTVLTGSMGVNYNNYLSYIGDLVGFSSYSYFTNCTSGNSSNTGNELRLYSYGTIGGIVGHAAGGGLTNCKNYANVYYYWNESNNMYTGGIVGRATLTTTLNNCENKGLIKFAGAKSDSKDLAPYMGQIIGYKASTVTCTNCSCNGTCNYDNLRKVGGFLGIGRTDQARFASTGVCGHSE